MMIWLFAVLNFLISAWNSYAAGVTWELQDSPWTRLVAGSALLIGFVGMMYSFVLAAIGLGYLGERFLLSANVFLGIPMIFAGIVITVQSWIQAVKRGDWKDWLVTIWNTFAIIWDIRVWFASFKEVGGFSGALEDLADSDNAKIVAVVALIGAVLLSFGLFQKGRSVGRKRAA